MGSGDRLEAYRTLGPWRRYGECVDTESGVGEWDIGCPVYGLRISSPAHLGALVLLQLLTPDF
jgi:hypothetical protein